MAMREMYPGSVNSRQTELAQAINETQTSFTVLDGTVLPPAPNVLTLGTDESAETVLYTGLSGNTVSGVIRGFEGTAKSWAVGTKLARYFTAYDHNAFLNNILEAKTVADASLPKAGGALTGPLRISSWGEISASTGGYVLYGHNCYLDSAGVVYRYRNTHANMGARGIVFRLGAGLQGAWMFDMGAIATTAGTAFTPTLKRILNTDDYSEMLAGAKDYVDAKPWQKYRLTQDNGFVKNLPQLSDLNTLTDAGQYDGNSLRNGPLGSVDGIWFFVEVIVHSSGTGYIIQRATRLEAAGATMYMRNRVNGVWSAWSPDVFQSGVDAKQGIVNAINAKGGSASMNDDWATLAAKVNAIQTGPKYATGVAITGAANDRSLFMRRKGGTESICYIAVSGLAFRPNRIIYNVGEFIYAYTSKSRDAGINGYNILSFDPDSSLSDFGIRIYERAGTLVTDGGYVNDSGSLMFTLTPK